MGIRYWLKKRVAGEEAGEDVPPNASIMHALFGREPPTTHALGEFTAETYPADVSDLLRRRQQVSDELLTLDITTAQGRQAAIPRLRDLLRIYPHALAYELLIQAYIDAGRWDEAKGVAFAARERRTECARSPLPEMRAEIERLHEWSPEEVDRVREELVAEGRV
ncbi:MAG TPA: hypothetical protein VHG28_20060 [Longimicrobiaceae bacterium]|nr:hypothetical protein [Longimicrobiaceae bacterium]